MPIPLLIFASLICGYAVGFLIVETTADAAIVLFGTVLGLIGLHLFRLWAFIAIIFVSIGMVIGYKFPI